MQKNKPEAEGCIFFQFKQKSFIAEALFMYLQQFKYATLAIEHYSYFMSQYIWI